MKQEIIVKLATKLAHKIVKQKCNENFTVYKYITKHQTTAIYTNKAQIIFNNAYNEYYNDILETIKTIKCTNIK